MAVQIPYTPFLLLPLALSACGHDFGLQYYVDAEQSDSGLIEDSGVAWDEEDPAEPGEPAPEEEEPQPEEEETPGEQEEPEEPQPEEEEEPEPQGDEPQPEEEEEPELPEDPADEDDCLFTSDQVYVIDQDSEHLFLFDPDHLSLTDLGELDCDMWVSPESMGVARDGYAYVRYSDDSVYQVDLDTLECSLTSYSDRSTGFGSFGMGYATDSSETWRDQLYVVNDERLGRLNTSTWTLDTLGRISSQAELTGNAAGELWGVLPLETPAVLVEFDKEDASVLQTIDLLGFPDPGNIDTFAFATWGGDFWIFVRSYGMGNSTEVYQVEPDGTMQRVVEGLGINVVGAGVSTCAPS